MMTAVRTAAPALDSLRARLRDGADRRRATSAAYVEVAAPAIAACAADMADRFFAGATLLVAGSGAHATDAQHNSVEYVHPVLPGCRALPALSLSSDPTTLSVDAGGERAAALYSDQVRLLGRRGDILLVLASSPVPDTVVRSLEAAAGSGILTVALTSGEAPAQLPADHVLHVPTADDAIARELHLATYHILWELVHIVLNHRGIATEVRA